MRCALILGQSNLFCGAPPFSGFLLIVHPKLQSPYFGDVMHFSLGHFDAFPHGVPC